MTKVSFNKTIMSKANVDKSNNLTNTDNWGREDVNARGEDARAGFKERDDMKFPRDRAKLPYDEINSDGLGKGNHEALGGKGQVSGKHDTNKRASTPKMSGSITIDDPKGKANQEGIENY